MKDGAACSAAGVVCGKAMPQGVERDALVDLGHVGCGVAGAVELARGHRLRRIAPQTPYRASGLVP